MSDKFLAQSSIALATRIGAVFVSFILSLVLTRILGAADAGMYFLSFTIVTICSNIGRIGTDNALVRFVASYNSVGDNNKVEGVYRKVVVSVFVVSVVMTVLSYLLAPYVSIHVFNNPVLVKSLQIFSLAIVPISLLSLHAYALQGLSKIADSVIILNIVTPVATILLIPLLGSSYGVSGAAISFLVGASLCAFWGYLRWRIYQPTRASSAPFFSTKELISSSAPLLVVSISNMIIAWAPMLVLGAFFTSSDVAIYGVAERVSLLISFFLAAINSAVAPKFAAFYRHGQLFEIEILARKSALIVIAVAIPLLIGIVLCADKLLLLFGSGFNQGATALIILSIGQFVNAGTGSVGYLLMMTGRERYMKVNLVVCSVLMLISSFLIVPFFGVIGAAAVSATILAMQNIVASILVMKKLNISATPFFKPMQLEIKR